MSRQRADRRHPLRGTPGAMALSSDSATLEDQYGLPAGLSSEEGERLAFQTHEQDKNESSCKWRLECSGKVPTPDRCATLLSCTRYKWMHVQSSPCYRVRIRKTFGTRALFAGFDKTGTAAVLEPPCGCCRHTEIRLDVSGHACALCDVNLDCVPPKRARCANRSRNKRRDVGKRGFSFHRLR